MKLAFWRKEENDCLVPAPDLSGACKHVWTNWSDPELIEVSQYSFVAGESRTVEGYRQTRKCLSCNMWERRLA